MTKQLKADIALLLVTVGWGSSFILTKNALGDLPTYNFLAIRFLLAFLISSAIFFRKMIKVDKETLKYGIILGVVLYLSYAFQTVGLNYTTVSKSAFITGFNVILVPIFSSLMIKVIPDKKAILSVVLAFIGLGLLTLNNDLDGINIGDIYTFICAVIFALYIILVGKYTVKTESVSLAVIQLGVVGLLSLFTSMALENPIMPTKTDTWINILILSIVCTSGAFIVQSIAQTYTTATHTALIFTGEPVFAAIFEYIIYSQMLSPKGLVGAILILGGMVISEIDFKELIKSKKLKNSIQE